MKQLFSQILFELHHDVNEFLGIDEVDVVIGSGGAGDVAVLNQGSDFFGLVFIVGGPYGFSDTIHKRGNEEVSLSRMTLSHQMVRMFFVEQIYRAMTILNGEPYHHE